MTSWTVACQASLSMLDSPNKNTGVGGHALLHGILPTPGTESRSPALQADSLLSEPPGKPCHREKKAQIPKKPRGNTESSTNIMSLGEVFPDLFSIILCISQIYCLCHCIALRFDCAYRFDFPPGSEFFEGSLPNFSFCFQ